MVGVCNSPSGDIDFPDNSGNIVIEEKKESIKNKKNDPTIWEKRAENVKEVLDLLVNGNPISQLLLKPELTNKAKEELINLREKTTTEEVRKNAKEVEKLKEKKIKIVKEMEDLAYRKEKLKQEIDLLEQKKRLIKGTFSSITALKERNR